MKLGDRTIERYRGLVTIVRPGEDGKLEQIQIRVEQLPNSWWDEVRRELPEPAPPRKGGKEINGQIVPTFDEEDPTYVEAHRLWNRRIQAKQIRDATIDERVTWETPDELRQKDPAAYYDAIFAELDAAFSPGEIAKWVLTIVSIDQVGGADVALAEESLFQGFVRAATVQGMAEPEGEAE